MDYQDTDDEDAKVESQNVADNKWKLFGQRFLNLCIEHQTGLMPVDQSTAAQGRAKKPVSMQQVQAAYQYKPMSGGGSRAMESASAGAAPMITTPITVVQAAQTSISAVLPKAKKGFKPR